MTEKSINIIFQVVLTFLFFSLWAGFALLVVNPNFQSDLPGYTIGRLCLWELFALILSALLARFVFIKWKGISIGEDGNRKWIKINIKYAYILFIYFVVAVITGIWQFWIFSQNF